jgi:hypothetical protein
MKSVFDLAREVEALAEKATKGPWTSNVSSITARHRVTADTGMNTVGIIDSTAWLDKRPEQYANAELIAHAGTNYAAIARALVEALSLIPRARREHRVGSWMQDYCEWYEDKPCDCGADEFNARIDALIGKQ